MHRRGHGILGIPQSAKIIDNTLSLTPGRWINEWLEGHKSDSCGSTPCHTLTHPPSSQIKCTGYLHINTCKYTLYHSLYNPQALLPLTPTWWQRFRNGQLKKTTITWSWILASMPGLKIKSSVNKPSWTHLSSGHYVYSASYPPIYHITSFNIQTVPCQTCWHKWGWKISLEMLSRIIRLRCRYETYGWKMTKRESKSKRSMAWFVFFCCFF